MSHWVMGYLPAAIVFVNNDLVDQVRNFIVTQLNINTVLDGYQFDSIIAADPAYPQKIKQLNQRVLVIRDFRELENRSIADVVIFVKAGMASVLKNNFGPPAQTYLVRNLYWGQLCSFSFPYTNICGPLCHKNAKNTKKIPCDPCGSSSYHGYKNKCNCQNYCCGGHSDCGCNNKHNYHKFPNNRHSYKGRK